MNDATIGNPMIGDDLEWLEALITRARRNAEHITDAMIRFIDDMAVNTGRWGARMYFSKNQRAFARGIEAALDHAGVPGEGDG